MNKILSRAIVFCSLAVPVTVFAAQSEIDVNTNLLENGTKTESYYQPDGSSVSYTVVNGKAFFESDIVLGDHDHIQAYGVPSFEVTDANDESDFQIESAWSGNTTWLNSTVPYIISSASQGDINAIQAGMNLISSRSGVKFVQRTNQSDYIEVIKSDGCWSYVGRTGGRQQLSIGNGCAYAGIVAHEFMHALGFYHEQSRYDRDNHVRILFENIRSGTEGNFAKHSQVTTSLGDYDYRSIMHYTYKSFSVNGLPTIESLNPNVPSSQLGQRNALTNLDAAAVVAIYGDGGSGPGPQPGGELENGVAKTGLSGSQGSEQRFTLEVPANASSLTFNISGGSGDADLYVRFGGEPTLNTYDCRPWRNGNNETCTVDNVQAGTYYVMVQAYSSFSGVRLIAEFDEGAGGGSELTELDIDGARSSWKDYEIVVPQGASSLDVNISGGSGDADLYVRFGSAPTLNDYDCRPWRNGNNETCSFSNPPAGTWYIRIRGYSAFSGVDLNAKAE